MEALPSDLESRIHPRGPNRGSLPALDIPIRSVTLLPHSNAPEIEAYREKDPPPIHRHAPDFRFPIL